MQTLIYLHGFNSSPQSAKAQLTKAFIEANCDGINIVIPQLPYTPAAAAAHVSTLVTQHQDSLIGFIGSSLGGYLSTYFVEKIAKPVKAVVINPAVRPYELLQDFLGEQVHPYTNEVYTLDKQHIEELKALDTPQIEKVEQYWLLQQEGDEVLDYRQATEKYRKSKVTLEPEGAHEFVGYERFLSDIVKFLEIA